MSYHDPASIAQALAEHKRHGMSFAYAWARVMGPEPRVGNGQDGGVERFVFDAMKLAYHGGGKPCRLDRDSASDPEYRGNGVGQRGKNRPAQLVA